VARVAVLLAALTLAPSALAAQRLDALNGHLAQRPLLGPRRATSQSSAQQQRALASDLLVAINTVRQSRGLRPLVASAKLSVAAASHTREMGTQGYFEHESFDSTPFWKRIERWYPSRGWRVWSVGENLLYSSPTVGASEGVNLWMNSPPHRANLLSKTWREVGISAMYFESAPGEYAGGPVTIVTADFGTRR
jgi:uncharacterized protein YkwD